MDFTIALIGATAVVCAGLMLLYFILDDTHLAPRNVRPLRTLSVAQPAPVSCAPDGVAITSQDRLRTAVTMLDRMIISGRAPDGKPTTMLETGRIADAFAQQQTSPDVTLAQLSLCGEWLIGVYAHGYWMLSSALTREAYRRRTAHQTVTPGAP